MRIAIFCMILFPGKWIDNVAWILPVSSHNHGSVKNGFISNRYLSDVAIFPLKAWWWGGYGYHLFKRRFRTTKIVLFFATGRMSQYKAPKGLFDSYSSTPPPQKIPIFTSEHRSLYFKIKGFPNPPVWAGTTTSGRPRHSKSSFFESFFARLPALEAAPEEEKSDKAGPLESSGPFFFPWESKEGARRWKWIFIPQKEGRRISFFENQKQVPGDPSRDLLETPFLEVT